MRYVLTFVYPDFTSASFIYDQTAFAGLASDFEDLGSVDQPKAFWEAWLDYLPKTWRPYNVYPVTATVAMFGDSNIADVPTMAFQRYTEADHPVSRDLRGC